MLNRFIETCNVAHWLCHWNLLFCLSSTSPCGPHHWSVLEYLTSVLLTPFTDMCGRGRGQKICGRGRQNVCVRTSLTCRTTSLSRHCSVRPFRTKHRRSVISRQQNCVYTPTGTYRFVKNQVDQLGWKLCRAHRQQHFQPFSVVRGICLSHLSLSRNRLTEVISGAFAGLSKRASFADGAFSILQSLSESLLVASSKELALFGKPNVGYIPNIIDKKWERYRRHKPKTELNRK